MEEIKLVFFQMFEFENGVMSKTKVFLAFLDLQHPHARKKLIVRETAYVFTGRRLLIATSAEQIKPEGLEKQSCKINY